MRFAVRLAVVVIALAMTVTPVAGAWSNYFGTATMYQPALGGPTSGNTGYNYWTNNRVYRPTGHPFVLGYANDGGVHWSAQNWNTNPFYFNSYGYNNSTCFWDYQFDGSSSVDPVTCQITT